MSGHRAVPQFMCEWQCNCGSIIGWSGAEALVYSQTGAHRHCPYCGSQWKITPDGAQLLPKADFEIATPGDLAGIQFTGTDVEYANVPIPTLGGDVLDRIALEMDERESPGREDTD